MQFCQVKKVVIKAPFNLICSLRKPRPTRYWNSNFSLTKVANTGVFNHYAKAARVQVFGPSAKITWPSANEIAGAQIHIMAYHISKFQVFSFGGFGVFVHRKKVVKKCNVVVHQAFQIRKLQKFLIRKVFNRKKKNKKKNRIKEKKRCQSSQKLNVGAETTSPGGHKFEIFILLPRLVFEE